MINSQEIIERSVYKAILDVALAKGLTLNPNNYLPVTTITENQFKIDKAAMGKNYIAIYGPGNSESKGLKETPRIVVESQGFYPGDIGLPKVLIENEVGVGYHSVEVPYETIDQFIDIRVVASNQKELRILQQVLFNSIPQRGYIKPYTSDTLLKTGNIFIELVNFYNQPDNDLGILEKVYQFSIKDCILEAITTQEIIAPITDINIDIGDNQNIHLQT